MRQRAVRELAAKLGRSALVLLAGLALGALSKWADYRSMFLADLTSGMALWVLLATAAALGSRSSWRAGLHVLLLLGGMVCAYYLTAEWMGVPWSRLFVIGWGLLAAVSPVFGFFVWYARGRGLHAWLLSLGVLGFQVLAALVFPGGVTDAAVIPATAVLLLRDKIGGSHVPRHSVSEKRRDPADPGENS